MNKTYTLIKNAPKVISLILAFLMPVFFLPYTSEFFEFNKWALLLAATLILLVITGASIIFTRKFAISKSPVDLSIIIFIAVVILSSIFSLHKASSIFGSYGRWFPSLMGFLTVVIYYYLTTPHLNSDGLIRKGLYAFLGGATISSITALLSYFKIYLGESNFLKSPSFTLTGSATSTVLLAALGTILALALLVHADTLIKKPVLSMVLLVNFFLVALIGLPLGWILVIAGTILVLLATPTKKLQQNKFDLLVIAGGVAALVIVLLYPATKTVLVNTEYPKELVLSVQESWISASSAVRDFPILGSGPSTFYLNFPRYKSVAFNTTDLWNLRFDKPYNELFNILGTMGIVGILAAIYLGMRMVKFAFNASRNTDDSGDTLAIKVGLVLTVLAFFLTYATVLNTFIVFLFLSLLVAKTNIRNESNVEDMMTSLSSLALSSTDMGDKRQAAYAPFIVATPLFILTILAGYQAYKVYAAEYYTRQGIEATQANDGGTVLLYQGKAINTNPRIDAYHTVYAQTNLAIANVIASNQELTDTDKQNIQTLIAQSIRSIRLATEVLNPLNVNNWEVRAGIYRVLIGSAENADQWALSSYNTAIQLDSSNPRLRVNLGGIYFLNKDYLQAANQFKQATLLKTDYANAYYNLSQALIMLKDYDNAKIALETTKRLVPQDSPDAQIVDKDLQTLATLTGTKAPGAVPSIEELSQPGPTETNPASQEPLSKPE